MSKIQTLTILNEVRKDLSLLNKIDFNKVEGEAAISILKLLVKLRDEGYKGFKSVGEFGLLAAGKSTDISQYTEILENIESINTSTDNIEQLFRTSPIMKADIFKPLSGSLSKLRAEVRESLASQFSIPGFPIPIVGGKLNSIVAPSHSGKTMYAMGLAFNLARIGKKVVFLSTEESEEAFIDKTMGISDSDVAWDNISLQYAGKLNRADIHDLISASSNEGFDFIIIDYLKKSMWEEYTSDHVVMEEINSSILHALEAAKSKISVFAFVQSNKGGYDRDLKAIADNPMGVAGLIDGGLPVFRSADNLLFIKPEGGARNIVVCKARRNNDLLGKIYQYNVDDVSFNLSIFKNVIASSSVSRTGAKRNTRII